MTKRSSEANRTPLSSKSRANSHHRLSATKQIVLKPHPPRSPHPLPPLPTPNPDKPLPESLTTLHATSVLLQQLHVRNRNQHRNQAWFKSLNLLRRSLRHLLSLYIDLYILQHHLHPAPNLTSSSSTWTSHQQSATTTTAATVRARFEAEATTRSKQEQLSTWIRERLLPECYVRFSSVVADVQFAPLGVVLMGVLGDVAGFVGLPRDDEVGGSVGREVVRGVVETNMGDVGEVVGRVKRETGGEKGAEVEISWRRHDERSGRESAVQGDDLGEVVQRDDQGVRFQGTSSLEPLVTKQEGLDKDDLEATGDSDDGSTIDPVHEKAAPSKIQETKVKKKQKRKKNAIDDLFAGFN